jgi:hypothetical protein
MGLAKALPGACWRETEDSRLLLRHEGKTQATVWRREDGYWQFALEGKLPSAKYANAGQAKAQATKLFLRRWMG